MIERLADPLVHLIRNAIDHGLESAGAACRSRQVADRAGSSSPRAHAGAEVLVTVTDDGAGLNAARIRAKAEEQGLIAPGAAMSRPRDPPVPVPSGLLDRADDLGAVRPRRRHGRGQAHHRGVRGTIDLTTMPGQGTTVTLRLPLTLAIIEGLLIRVGEGRYIIPLSAVEECVELTAADEARSRGRNFLNIRGDLVPFLRLRELFDSRGEPDPHQKIIIISSGETRVGLVVDQIIGNHQTVIKSLSKLHSDVTMFSGATILGDGSVALILDVAQLVALGQAKPRDKTTEAA